MSSGCLSELKTKISAGAPSAPAGFSCRARSAAACVAVPRARPEVTRVVILEIVSPPECCRYCRRTCRSELPLADSCRANASRRDRRLHAAGADLAPDYPGGLGVTAIWRDGSERLERLEHGVDVAVDAHLGEDLAHHAALVDHHRRAQDAERLLAVEALLAPG